MIIFIGLMLLGCFALLYCDRQQTRSPEELIAKRLVLQVDSFSAFIEKDFLPTAKTDTNGKRLQARFLKARRLYKRFEWAAEYFTASTSRFVNGPPVEEISLTGRYTFPPEGLQVIEDLLFPVYDRHKKQELIRYLTLLLAKCEAYRAYFSGIPIADWQVFDATKLEIFRILTLGITGFDNPLSLHSMAESAVSLDAVLEVLEPYLQRGNADSLRIEFKAAANYLRWHPDFEQFNRAFFIRKYGNRLSDQLSHLQDKLAVQMIRYNRLLRQDARTLFDADAFDVNAYAPGRGFEINAKRVALGKKLFTDPILSGTHTRSCASCHQPGQAFSDGLMRNTVIDGRLPLLRNTPTLINAALQPFSFYDLRAASLEDQVYDVIQNKEEMHGSLHVATRTLWRDENYRLLFTEAFPKKQRNGIDTLELANAIASYVRSLTNLNSRFDRYMRGDNQAMNLTEIEGFNLFMGKAKCATCHYMPLFNGVFPPKYNIQDAEVIGVPRSSKKPLIDPDMGRYTILPFASQKNAFKTTGIRNVSQTAPYMHNGVFQTLEEVVDFYNYGGGVGMGIALDNQTLSPDSLHLTDKEKKALVAFMKSLESR